MSISTDLYHSGLLIQCGDEDVSYYCLGGYHPISLGDKLSQDRYQIRHKLGFGYFSTVWLARDTKLERWVAIKIMKTSVSKPCPDISIRRSLHGKEASTYIADLLDTFIHQGPNGSHQCLVLELLGPILHMVGINRSCDPENPGHLYDREDVLNVPKKLLQAVASLHKAGYAHGNICTYDIAFTSNVMTGEDEDYTSPRLAYMSEDEIMEILGAPESVECIRRDGKPLDPGMPTEIVYSAVWEEWMGEEEEDVRLLGLGVVFAHGHGPCSSSPRPPFDPEAPEAIFTDQLDYRVDLFRTGSVIYSLLFDGWEPFYDNGDQYGKVAEMIHFLGKLPKEWEPKWAQIKEADGAVGKPDSYGVPGKLKRQFDEKIQDPNLKKLLPVLQGLMRFRPSDRLEASEALEMVDSIIETSKDSDLRQAD